jgi:hypothetical protein
MKMNRTPLLFVSFFAACTGSSPEGIAPSKQASTTVKLDFDHRPLPEIPLPNDIATRFDPSSPTNRRINASMVAPTSFERRVRTLVDRLDGWGVFQTITIPFTGPLDVESIIAGHRDATFDPKNDVIYLINVDKKSPRFGKIEHLDLGNGNYPVVLERQEYWKNDPRGWTLSIAFEEEDEDKNGNGRLDPGEDTDADGELDVGNYLPGMRPARDDLAARSDALMTFYERQTNTVIARPMIPLDERTTYALVITRRLLDADGQPVGSPYPWVNHTAQTEALKPLLEVLPEGLSKDDIAFAFSFTTQSIESEWMAVRDGLYGRGVQADLGKDYPAELAGLEVLRDKSVFTDMQNPHVLYTEDVIDTLKDAAVELLGQDDDSIEYNDFVTSLGYIDFHVIGSFTSPQLFERGDPDGNRYPLDEQSWPADLTTVPAKSRPETVYFWLTVPRKEISDRGQGKAAPIVILSHGYTSSRLELIRFAGEFAKHGFATLAIDCVSHGLSLSPIQQAVIEGLFTKEGFTPFLQAIFKDRAADLNKDEVKDSGADFWTAYLFHTRDVVRQSVLDHMQLVRIFRSFDGQKRWQLDVDANGEGELAGDFDADGTVDVGGPSVIIGMTGGSLGGIMSTAVAALEPGIDVTVPIAGGGGLSDVGIRSQQGGVREAVGLRLLGPLYTASKDPETGKTIVETIVPNLNDDATILLATIDGIEPGDTMVATNIRTGERGCAYVDEQGRARSAVASDVQDPIQIAFYQGDALELGVKCSPIQTHRPKTLIEKFEKGFEFQGETYKTGGDLVALAEGYALPRAHPKLRRFMSLSQLVLDPADPGVLARYLLEKPLSYAGSNETTGAHAMIVTTVGDMNVPASTGGTIGRAAGLIDYLDPNNAYGKPANQMLIETYSYEAVNTFKRYTDPNGNGVHIDVEDFGDDDDLWTGQIPRLNPPLRLGLDKTDKLGGVSGAIFPYPIPTGQHGFAFPGEQTDTARRRCERACTTEGGCGCENASTFDLGRFMFNMLGGYFASGGKQLSIDRCNARGDCEGFKPPPPKRPTEQLH